MEFFSRQDALADGRTDDELARLIRGGQWTRIRRGAYVAGEQPDGATRHALLVRATMAGLRLDAVLSHQSAAVLHGFPLWKVPLEKVHVTRRPPASSDNRGVLRCHVARLRDDELVRAGHLTLTDPVRTALDLARSLPFEVAVVCLDAAVRAGRLDPVALRRRLFDIAGSPGSRAAARAVGLTDGRSESVGESRSRVVLHQLGLAPSALQFEVRDDAGRLVGRTDFAWEAERVIGEFDGRIKYGRLLRPGQTPGDAVFAEKRREDAIRDLGFGVVRWGWADLSVPQRIGERVRRALGRGSRNGH